MRLRAVKKCPENATMVSIQQPRSGFLHHVLQDSPGLSLQFRSWWVFTKKSLKISLWNGTAHVYALKQLQISNILLTSRKLWIRLILQKELLKKWLELRSESTVVLQVACRGHCGNSMMGGNNISKLNIAQGKERFVLIPRLTLSLCADMDNSKYTGFLGHF